MHRHLTRIFALIVLGLVPYSFSYAQSGGDDLPESWREGLAPGVNWGLAANYPQDIGIADNPYVFGAEDFETGAVQIPTEEDRYKNNVTVTQDAAYTGRYSAEHSWPEGLKGPTTRFVLPAGPIPGDERPAYFIRMCFNYDNSFHPGNQEDGVGVKGFGVYAERTRGGAYTPADGTNWYSASVQYVGWGGSRKPEANDGFLWVGHLYSYNPYPEQAVADVGEIRVSDPPPQSGTDRPYRFSAYATPFQYLRFGEWNCFEVGLYLNTPGRHDGEARFWIDGVLQSRVTNMRYRDIEDFYPTHAHLNLHRTTDDFPQTMKRYCDNIVIARRYIGPVNRNSPDNIKPAAPRNLRTVTSTTTPER